MEEFEDDETVPVRPTPPESRSSEASELSEQTPQRQFTRPGEDAKVVSTSPASDAFNDDVTIMVGRQVSPQRAPTPTVEHNFRSAPTVGRDALADRTDLTLGRKQHQPRPPIKKDRGNHWTPPLRPSAPGVDSIRVRKKVRTTWFVALALLLAIAAFVLLFVFLGSAGPS